jgi:hypothetical protein
LDAILGWFGASEYSKRNGLAVDNFLRKKSVRANETCGGQAASHLQVEISRWEAYRDQFGRMLPRDPPKCFSLRCIWSNKHIYSGKKRISLGMFNYGVVNA